MSAIDWDKSNIAPRWIIEALAAHVARPRHRCVHVQAGEVGRPFVTKWRPGVYCLACLDELELPDTLCASHGRPLITWQFFLLDAVVFARPSCGADVPDSVGDELP